MKREDNRAAMPTVAAIVDEYRALFPDLKVIYASENGKELGQCFNETNVFNIPQNYRKPAGGWK